MNSASCMTLRSVKSFKAVLLRTEVVMTLHISEVQSRNVLGTLGESGSSSAKETVVREHIDTVLKIALTLHYLGTDKDYHSLQWVFYVPHNTSVLLS